jgi:hypothetical protein
LSEPNSLRQMENVMVGRNGSMAIRPGMRHLSYARTPDTDPLVPDTPGVAMQQAVLSAPEVFYTNEGQRALLIAVRELNQKVGFRALLFHVPDKVVHALDDPEVGFSVPQGLGDLQFSEATRHVEFLQIDNQVLALSDNGEPARLFFVGEHKVAKKLQAITVPEWTDSVPSWQDDHKLTVIHPNADWILQEPELERRNIVVNPRLAHSTLGWAPTLNKLADLRLSPDGGGELRSLPRRTNMVTSPLHDVATTGTAGWNPTDGATVAASGSYLQVAATEDGDHYAMSAKTSAAVTPGRAYRAAVTVSPGYGTGTGLARAFAYAADGSVTAVTTLTIDTVAGRWTSPAVVAPTGTVAIRIGFGVRISDDTPSAIRFKDVVLCPAEESTAMFHGGTGFNYYWLGAPNQSASVWHPSTTVQVRTAPQPFSPVRPLSFSAKLESIKGSIDWAVAIQVSKRDGTTTHPAQDSGTVTEGGGPVTAAAGVVSVTGDYIEARVLVQGDLGFGEVLRFDEVLLEPDANPAGAYFDGSSQHSAGLWHEWDAAPHASPSRLTQMPNPTAGLVAETPTAETLVAAGGAANNPYKMGLFYTFENEVGESAPSAITEVRMQRPRSNWIMETPDPTTGNPSGTATFDPGKACDQLAVSVPYEAWQQALDEGALRINVYTFNWSDQDPVPVVAQLDQQVPLYSDPVGDTGNPLPSDVGRVFRITPQRTATTVDALLPTKENRVNYSVPPDDRNGYVAGERLVLLGSPSATATIRWSSNRPGNHLNLSSNWGGGQKTLSTGNLNLPYAVVLWQNPQSVDTLTVLCSDDNGMSTSYYMQPAQGASGSSGTTTFLSFEETTSTPGSVSPFGAEVANNALYRPLDGSLTKSTASNYNINHSVMTDDIANMWSVLLSKHRIMSAQLDNRLYYLVHNPRGVPLMPDAFGNEIWVYDINQKEGHWSRLLIQGNSLKPVTVGSTNFMSVSRPDGLFYLDPDHHWDDVVQGGSISAVLGDVRQAPIPWMFETNTQGANRAHDAWAHLQQVGIQLGDFAGKLEYGVRGQSVNGRYVNISKTVADDGPELDVGMKWDIEDHLLVRRDMKEWFFFARSVPDEWSRGEVSLVQYRYTPVSVNVGYEFGSVETFEYGQPASDYARNGIPLPYMDYNRP